MTDAPIPFGAPASDVEAEIDRLVVRGLAAPLSTQDAGRLDQLIASSPEYANRARDLTQVWLLSGLVTPRQDGLALATRRWALTGGLGLAACASAGAWIVTHPTVQTYQAPDNAALKIALSDGSRVVLSRGGRMEVQFEPHRRQVRLLAGEAFYAVAKAPNRPFQVTTGQHRLTVLGTQFNIDPRPDGLRVDLLEGALRVESLTGSAPPLLLKPGQRFWEGRTPSIVQADVDSAAAWSDGRLIFNDVSLAEVASQIQRHTGQTLSFVNPRLSDLRFSGVLRLDDVEAWKPGLEAVLPIRMKVVANGYDVTPRPR